MRLPAAIAVPRYHSTVNALRFLAAALQRLVDKMDPQEGRYRMLFEHSPLPMWVLDIETLRFLAVNDAAVELYGYRREEFLGMTVHRVRLPEERQSVHELVSREAGEVIRGALRHVTRQGREIDIEAVGHLVNWRGRAARLVMLNDVTERNRTQQELERLNRELEDRVRSRTEQLEAANKELEAFSYSVSHDLRAPLRTVSAFTQALAEDMADRLDDRALDHIRRVLAAASRMSDLIEALLELGRIHRAPLGRYRVDLSALAATVVEEFVRREPGREVVCEIATNLVVEADGRLIRILLDNLLGNSWKFTSKQARAHIALGVDDGDERVFFVKDDGVGFDMSQAGRLFTPFHRLHPDSDFPGTGIGLATVRRIVERHGGRIWAESAVGAGTKICFTLPAEH
jgi:hypothetical protein